VVRQRGGPGEIQLSTRARRRSQKWRRLDRDREEYRIVVYTGDGKFVKTMQIRNLVCAFYFDSRGEPWMATGQDGQFLKLDRNGTVLGAVGNGMGIGTGQFIEASYWVMDKQDNPYAGDTSVGRVTKMLAPR
jgi:hypothetical protein